MAGVLNVIYSLAVLALALGGVVFVLTRTGGPDGESRWSLFGDLAAVAVFLIAMVATLLAIA